MSESERAENEHTALIAHAHLCLGRMKQEHTDKYDYQVLSELITALETTPHDWSTCLFIMKYRDIFSIVDSALKGDYLPYSIVSTCTDDECAAGITYMLDFPFARYHSKVKDIPEEHEKTKLIYRGVLDLFL